MRYRLMATYRGVPYEVGMGPSNSEVVLFAACPPPEELGFEPATGHWRKPVIRAEIDTLWESRPVGMFRGQPCIVLDDPGERLHIAYLGTDAERATSLGYWQVDRGVFELLTPREEVTELTEERVEKPLRWGEVAEATGPMATYPYGTAPWPITAPQVAALPLPPDAAAAEETVPGAGGPLDEAGAADVAPAEVPAAEVPAADPPSAEARPAVVSAADASPPGIPEASIPPAKAPVSDTPLADALLAETQRARRGAGTPRASAPLTDDPMAGTPRASAPRAGASLAAPLAGASLAAPLADDPMADHPADSPLAGVPLASVSPETVAPVPVPVPSAVSAAADDGAQAATGSWPAYPSVGTDPYSDPVSAGDALSYPDEDDSADLPVPPGFYDPPDAALAGIAPAGDIGGRAARRQRVTTREIFCELADLASIPRAAYALETETDGAICLLPTPDGFDVFMAADGARHELRSFAEEEAAYFYLFGVLAADAVRSGALAPTVTMANQHGGPV
jgi:hypothetical protein